MVSELSARLLKGYSISYTTSSPVGSSKRFSGFSSASSSGSGSCATSSQQNLQADTLSSSMSRRSHNGGVKVSRKSYEDQDANQNDACFKRRKIDELRFAASQAKQDIEKGGLVFPSIHSKKPRALAGFDIDMSNIRLLSAKSVADSPFLTKPSAVAHYVAETTACEFDQLFAATHQLYSKRWIRGDVNGSALDWEKSSAGSLTSDSESSCAVEIPPLLDDALKYRPSTADPLKFKEPTAAAIETVSMRVALENCDEPRSVPNKQLLPFCYSTP